MKKLNRNLLYTALFSSSILLVGCGGSEKETPDLTSVSPTAAQEVAAKSFGGSVIYNPSTSEIPYPNDILFSGTTDGSLNIPISEGTDSTDPRYALNKLDGFSTSSVISVGLSKEMDATTAAAAVKVYKVEVDASTKALDPTKFADAQLITDVQVITSGKQLLIFPTKPLSHSSSYLVLVTDALKDASGNSAQSGAVYNYLKSSNALIDASNDSTVKGLSNASAQALEPLRQLTQLHLAFAQAQSVSDNVIASWSFSTQSVGTVLNTAVANATNTTLAVQNTTLNTSALGGLGAADIYAGTVSVPYYSATNTTDAPTAMLTGNWKGQTGAELTRYSIALSDSPKSNADSTIPVLMTLPNSNSGQTKPVDGWPVVIFQHGITQNRSNALAVADGLAGQGYAVIAIDLPLHGITEGDSASSLRISGVEERTFDVDFVTQDDSGSITAAAPDSNQDTSGRHFVQLTSLLTTRDNMRQGISDLVQLKAALSNIAGADIDASNISFVGHSLGGMIGAGFVKQATDLKAAVFAMSGLQAANVLENSASFGPEIKAGLAAKGIQEGTADYNSFILAAQTAVDSGDPVNMVADISVPTLLFKVTNDDTVPNNVATAPLAGTDPWIRVQGLNTVTATGAVTDSKGVLVFEEGHHASLLRASAVSGGTATTVETEIQTTMQEAMISFIKTSGTAIQVTSDDTFDGE